MMLLLLGLLLHRDLPLSKEAKCAKHQIADVWINEQDGEKEISWIGCAFHVHLAGHS